MLGLKPGSGESQGRFSEFLEFCQLRREGADFFHQMRRSGLHQLYLLTLFQHALAHPDQRHDAEITVVPAVHQHGLQRLLAVALRGRQALHQRFQHLIDVRKGLRLDTLTGIDYQDRAFAGGKRPADLVGEIDMAWRVHQVDLIGLAIVCGIIQPYGLGLDGDTALALDIHAIEHLLLHLPVGEAAAELDQSIRQRGLAVVDMGDDREVPDMAEVGHVKRIPSKLLAGKIGPTGHCGNAETVGAALLQKR